MSAIPCVLNFSEQDVVDLSRAFPRRRSQPDLERAENNVRIHLAAATEAERLGLSSLQIESLRLAESWQQVADEIREEITQ
jgi:hypothetical protein